MPWKLSTRRAPGRPSYPSLLLGMGAAAALSACGMTDAFEHSEPDQAPAAPAAKPGPDAAMPGPDAAQPGPDASDNFMGKMSSASLDGGR